MTRAALNLAASPVMITLLEPPSANRWWRHVGPRVLTSQAAREYKALVAYSFGACTPYAGPVSVSVVWYRARRSGDLDKRLGVLLDALQGTAYVNDGQIEELSAKRIDGDTMLRGKVQVTVAALPTQRVTRSETARITLTITEDGA